MTSKLYLNQSKWVMLALFSMLVLISSIVKADPLKQDDADLSGSVIFSLKWNADGSRLAVGKGRAICGAEFGDERFAVQILDGESGQLTNTLVQPRCTARSLAWGPSGNMLISGDDDAGMWFWNMTTMRYIRTETVAFEGPSSILWRPDTEQLFGLVEASIYAYDLLSRAFSFDFPDFKTKQVTSIALSPDGHQLASGDSEGVIRLIDSDTHQLVTSFQPEPHPVIALDWDPDGDKLASGYADGTVNIWSTNGRLLSRLVGHTDNISQIKWNPNGDMLASASYDGTVRVWNEETGISADISYPGKVLALDWKPDSSQIAYGGVRDDFQDSQVLIVNPPLPNKE